MTRLQQQQAELLRPRGIGWKPMQLPDIALEVKGRETTAQEWLAGIALERVAERKDAGIDVRREAMVGPVTAASLRELAEKLRTTGDLAPRPEGLAYEGPPLYVPGEPEPVFKRVNTISEDDSDIDRMEERLLSPPVRRGPDWLDRNWGLVLVLVALIAATVWVVVR